MKIEKDKVVLMHYTLTDNEGDIIGSTKDDVPMAYMQGKGNIIPGLEVEMEGRNEGDKFKVHLPAENAYGKHNPELLHVVDRSVFQGEDEIVIGLRVNVQTSNGDSIANVSAFDDKTITLDLNHPLADKDLTFDVEIVEIRDATETEIEHGHVHGPGGHHH
ncbi:MAG: peptidylprolyl isomerase [Bacteroidetes bacterium]|nr:MAG: peptidylprolyl isomerase [Bacteroidota bacterium]